jgi:hypothetical protein
MGIRVFCPNGHRLNLKSHLAGKQGVCPHCGMTVNIPSLEKAEELGMLKNPRLSGREELAAGDFGGPDGSRGGAATLTLESAQPIRDAGMSADVPCEPSLASPYAPSLGTAANGSTGNGSGAGSSATHPDAPYQKDGAAARLDDGGLEIPLRGDAAAAPAKRTSSSAVVSSAVAEPTPTAAALESEVDPIAENPQAVWYVRTPQGGQYGPAAGDIMRKWIAEGRVQADFWVWREGWGDWQKASASIPSLGPSAVASGPAAAAVAPAAAAPSSSASAGAAPARLAGASAPTKPGEGNGYGTADGAAMPRIARSRRRGIHPLAILAVVGLGLVCLALFGVLVAMLAGAI